MVDRKYASVPIAPPHPIKKSRHSANPAINTLSITSCVSGGINCEPAAWRPTTEYHERGDL